MLLETGGVELGPLVEGGELGLVHDCVFFTQAQPAGIGGGVVGGVLLQDPPLEAVLPPLVLELPHVPRQGRVDLLLPVPEGGGVVVVPELEGGFRDANVLLVGLALLHHGGLVLHLRVLYIYIYILIYIY